MKTTMTEHVAAYLAERSMLGFRVSGPDARLLRSFAGFADEQDCGVATGSAIDERHDLLHGLRLSHDACGFRTHTNI